MTGAPRVPALPLVDVLARWDALCDRWDLDGDERSALVGSVEVGAVDDVAAYGLAGAERRIRLLVELDGVVARVHVDDACTREWLRRSNANLGDRTPIEVMSSSSEWIRWIVAAVGVAA